MEGTIVFSTVGLPMYGFDVFSIALPPNLTTTTAGTDVLPERRHTDGISVNFNAQFLDESGDSVVFVSERSGSSRIFQSSPDNNSPPTQIAAIPGSLHHDRPAVNRHDGRLYFVSAHEMPGTWFKSWSAIYSSPLAGGESATRLTPAGAADLSPAVSRSGRLVAVASYGSDPWPGDFRELNTEIVVFESDRPDRRWTAAHRGGWPAWGAGDDSVFFHKVADDGWWSVFCVDIAAGESPARRVTPAGVHAFTPAVSGDGIWIAVATRRKGRTTRQIELFNLETERFFPVTELLNPDLHHYNPFFTFVSGEGSGRLGYHRFRGESPPAPALQRVESPVSSVTMLRTTRGTFPSFSRHGDLIAVNGDFTAGPGIEIIRSDGSKRWTVLDDPAAFYTSWSPAEDGVLFTTLGPIFASGAATAHIARVTFNLAGDGDTVAAVKVLTADGTANNAFPSCSPDGRSVVFRSGRSGHKNLYIVDAVAGEDAGIRRLTEGAWIDTMPSWSPDGELIVFSSNRHDPANEAAFGIYLVRPDGTGVRRVEVSSEAPEKERINHVCFSPDGEYLLFTANLGGVTAEPVSMPNQFQPYGDLFVCRLDGGLTRLTCNPYENGTPAWGPAARGGGGVEEEMGKLSLGEPAAAGVRVSGEFDEPLWLTCDL